jgi:hypothetical protein
LERFYGNGVVAGREVYQRERLAQLKMERLYNDRRLLKQGFAGAE